MAVLKAIREFIVREVLKDSPKGVMTTLPNKDLVELNTQVIAQKLMQNGIDPTTLKNANQVENAIKLIEKRSKVDEGIKASQSAKVFDMEGKEIPKGSKIMGGKAIDDDLPPPGSRGGDEDIAAPIQSGDESLRDMMEAEIKKRIEKENKEAAKKFKDKMKDDPEDMATGGRAGFKIGSIDKARRAFLKAAASVGAGIGAFKTGLFNIGKDAPEKVVKQIIKTPNAPGKPEWFDALVTRVIREGDDVSKTMATKEREIVYRKKLDDETEVTVTQDLDNKVTRVDIDDSVRNVTGFDDPPTVSLQVTDEIVEEGGVRTKPKFEATENDYRNYATDPDGGYDTEFVENTVENTKDLTSDLTKIKSYATNKKETMKEFVESKKRKDNVKYANEKTSSYAADRGPDYDPSDYIEDMADDMATGGRAGFSAGKMVLSKLGITGSSRRFLEKVFGKQNLDTMITRDPEMHRGLLEVVEMFRNRDKEGLKMYMQKFLPHMDDATVEDFIIGDSGTEGIAGQLIRLGSGRDYKAKMDMIKKADNVRKLDNLDVTEEMIRKPNASGGLQTMLGE